MAPLLSRVKARLSSRGNKGSGKAHEVGNEDQSAEPIVCSGNSLSEALVTSNSSSNVDSQYQAVESLSAGHTDEGTTCDVAAPPLSPAQELWNRAYNAIKETETALVDSYERILSLEMQKDDSDCDLSHIPNLIQQNSEARRWLQMEQLVRTRLAKLEKEDKVEKTTGTVVQATLSFKDAISLAVQSIPQAALAWAGICFILQLSTNPVTESQSRRDGTAHVIARMEWYQQLSALLRQDDAAHRSPLAGLQAQLESQIVNLFEKVMLYLMKSVCSSFRNRISIILRDMLKLDDWVSSLKGVEDAECAVRRGYSVFDVQDIRFKLEQLVKSASSLERALLHDQLDQKCFQHLRVTDPRDDKTRIEQTKGGLLQDSYQWILDNADFQEWRECQQSRMFWIKGDPGKGKTMLLCGIIEELKKPSAYNGLLSFFFCQATDDRINSATSVLRGLIFLLIEQQPSLISHVRKKYDHAGQSLFQDRNAWVALSEIFTNILQDPQLKDTYLIVDALDECIDDRSQLLKLLVQESSVPSRIRWIVSSRNWPEIEERLDFAKTKTSLCLELNAQSVSEAVTRYIEIKVGNLADLKDYDPATQNAVQRHLVSNADNTFLWVALACEYLTKVSRYRAIPCLKMFVPGLEAFYGSMVQHMRTSDGDDNGLLEQILGIVTLVYRPITIAELNALIELPEDMSDGFEPLQDMIGRCGSFLTIRAQTVYFVHQSAKDFLLQKCNPPIFSSGEAKTHYKIFYKTLEAMSVTLHRDIYGLRAPGISIEQVRQPIPDPLDRIRYCCVYWVDHLLNWSVCRSSMSELDDGYLIAIDAFLETKYLCWLEALSLSKAMSEGVLAILQLEDFVQTQKLKCKTIELLKDAHRFILHNRWLIEHYPLQTYCSALIFSPTRSLIRRIYERDSPTWIRTSPRVEDDWSASLLKSGGHERRVTSIAFSPDAKFVASGSWDGTVRIWQAVTGQCLHILESTSIILSVIFSRDGKYLASRSMSTIDIWSTDSNKTLHTLEISYNHMGDFCCQSFVFSSDSKFLIVITRDLSLETWEVASGKCLRNIKNHPGIISGASLSQDGQRVMSTDSTVAKMWDIHSTRCLQTFKYDIDSKSSSFWSPDGRFLAVIYRTTNQVKIWDTDVGECLTTVQDPASRSLASVIAISHNSLRFAIMRYDGKTSIWDISSGNCLQKLRCGHNELVCGQFSCNGDLFALGSGDGTVSFWDVSDSQRLTETEGHSEEDAVIALSHDKMLVASHDSDRGNMRVWDTAAKKCLHIMESPVNFYATEFSSDGRLFAVGVPEDAVQIWNLLDGKCYRSLKGRGARADGIVFSRDGCYLASRSYTGKITIWDIASGDCLHLLQGYGGYDAIDAIGFSKDSRLIAYSAAQRTVKVCKVISGECLHTLVVSVDISGTIAFSHSSQYLVGGSNVGRLMVWNLLNEECVQRLQSHRGYLGSVVFSDNDKFLAAASPYHGIDVLRTSDGKVLQTLDMNTSYRALSIDSACSYLHTSAGTFQLDLVAASISAKCEGEVKMLDRYGYGFEGDGGWIMHNSERLLWLPPDFRLAWGLDVKETTIFLGRVNHWGPVTIEFVNSEDLPKHLGRDTVELDETAHSNVEELNEDSVSVNSD